MTQHFATIIVVHPRENRKKCSVEPLRDDPRFRFWTFPDRGSESTDGYVRLGLGGELIGPADSANGLLILDGTWKLASRMEPFYEDLPVRSLPAWQTAYPRVSKIHVDPVQGLATIEAIYAAYAEMGLPTDSLLNHYHWSAKFLEFNSVRIAELAQGGLQTDRGNPSEKD